LSSSEEAGTRTVWTGWDRRKRVGDQINTLDDASARATSANAGARSYELLAVVARGFRPPQYLESRDVGEDIAARSDDDSAPANIPSMGELRLTWSVVYRRIARTQAREGVAPYAIYLLGVNPPPDASVEDLAVFNDFYTNVHLQEVAEQRNALRAERYELVGETRPPYQGAPRFLASYEVDEDGAANRRHIGPPYSKGPEVWQRHKTPWRLWYRVL